VLDAGKEEKMHTAIRLAGTPGQNLGRGKLVKMGDNGRRGFPGFCVKGGRKGLGDDGAG